MFILRHVHKSYSSVVVLSDVSCEIPADKFVFIVGPSGSGKSTLLRLLSLVERPVQGSVELTLGGRRYSDAGEERPWPLVTCVFQRQFLWPHLTIRENITLPLRVRGVTDPDVALREVVHLFRMEGFVDRYPNEVSGGEAQRAALARALALKPTVILIDEAHGGLDLEQQATVNQQLVKLRSTGVGLVVVTHSISFARRYGDTLLVVEDRGVKSISTMHDLGMRAESPFLKRVLEL